ncbi:MAG: phosphoribosylglycinamide formyltransferase [Xanthomonadales bacterium]|nr:phosphoribosylglycinamide formyltransferase [Xanthomonadales bacterium]
MNQGKLRVAVLISGTGSNLKALIDGMTSTTLELDIVMVISNRQDAAGLQHAINASIPVRVLSHAEFPSRDAHDAAIRKALQSAGVQLIVLAGYMRILGEGFTASYEGRMINLHPSLLPLYKGLDTYNRVLQAGDNETGASIHFVTAGLDSGAVISQVRIPVLAGDDANSLSSRLRPLEHKLVVATVDLFCQGKIHYKKGKVFYQEQLIQQPLQLKADGTFS